MKKSLNIDKHQIDIYLMVDKILSAMKRHDEIISYWSRYIEFAQTVRELITKEQKHISTQKI